MTPRIDALARDGIILDRMYATRSCGPSRNSFWSGRNSIHNDVFNDYVGLSNPKNKDSGYAGSPVNFTMIPAQLAKAGYTSALFGTFVEN